MPRLVRRSARLLAGGGLATALVAGAPNAALGHVTDVAPPAPTPWIVITSWALEPLALVGIVAAAVLYVAAARRVDRAHPANPVPRRRIAAWIAGLGVLAIALFSFVDVYATTLFSVHMVQHLLLAMVSAPLLLLGAPITLLLRVASSETRQRWILPVLHSRPMRVVSHPVVGWLALAVVLWASHFSPVFGAALDDPGVHALEHALYLTAALLFWWPIVGADPHPHRMGHGMRFGYALLAMPLNSFLGLVLFVTPVVLYEHYASLQRIWGPTPLEDQQLAGGIMWAAGDLIFLVPLLFLTLAWFRAEEEKGRLYDEKVARERARLPQAADGGP